MAIFQASNGRVTPANPLPNKAFTEILQVLSVIALYNDRTGEPLLTKADKESFVESVKNVLGLVEETKEEEITRG